MLVSIINGIVNKLSEMYEEEYAIYTDFVEQDFKEPCFYIHLVNGSNTQELCSRYKRNYSFDIVYFPRNANQIDELCEISEQLYLYLETISIHNGLITGSGMNHHIEDGVLHFLVDYKPMVMVVQEEQDKMEILEWNGEVKDGTRKESK